VLHCSARRRLPVLLASSSGWAMLWACGQTHSRQHWPTMETSCASRQCVLDGARSSCGHSDAHAYAPFWHVHSRLQLGLNSSPSLYVLPSTSHGFAAFATNHTTQLTRWSSRDITYRVVLVRRTSIYTQTERHRESVIILRRPHIMSSLLL